MSRYYGGWAPYVPVAERRRQAARAMEKRRKAGQSVTPIAIEGRLIATTFWGRAWCDNLESYRDYENRLPRGRSYVRNGSVVDLQMAPGRVTAVVSGSELYDVTVTIKETPPTQWRAMCRDCAESIDLLVELLQGRFSKSVMERLCRQQDGLFPRPSDIRFTCSCPDHALMCKHVAAVLYGIGARLDRQPELLFRLRAVDEADLVVHVDAALPMSKQGPAVGRVLETDDISAMFGLDMAAPEAPATGQTRDKPRSGRGHSRAPTLRKALPAADAAAQERAEPRRAAVGKQQPAERASPSMADKKGRVKSDVPDQPSTTSNAMSAKAAGRKRIATAKALARAASEKAEASVKTDIQRPQAQHGGASATTHRRTRKSDGVSAVNVSRPAGSGRGEAAASRHKTAAAREPAQKPVKWW